MFKNEIMPVSIERVTNNDKHTERLANVSFEAEYHESHSWNIPAAVPMTVISSAVGKMPLKSKTGVDISGTLTTESANTKGNYSTWTESASMSVKIPILSEVELTIFYLNQTMNLPFKMVGEFVLADGNRSLCNLTGTFSARYNFGYDVNKRLVRSGGMSW